MQALQYLRQVIPMQWLCGEQQKSTTISCVLKKFFNPKNIKTHSNYSQSNKVLIVISIDSSRLNNISNVLQYIASWHFAYKTGIKPDSIKFTVSEKGKQALQSALLRTVIVQAKQKLKMK